MRAYVARLASVLALLSMSAWIAPVAALAALPGDVNLDNRVDSADVMVLTRHLRGDGIALTESALVAADVAPLVGGKSTPDGSVNAGDAVVLFRLATHSIGPAAPVLQTVSTPTSDQQGVTITGTAQSGHRIHLIVDGENREIQTTSTGSFTFTNVGLNAGTNNIYVVATLDGLTSATSNVLSRSSSGYTGARDPAPAPPAGQTIVWTPANSSGPQGPFVIRGPLTIPADSRLILAPGTEVRFDDHPTAVPVQLGRLIVEGRLFVQGADGNLVKLTSNTSPARGDWAGVEIRGGPSGSSAIRFAKIEYATTPVRIDVRNATVSSGIISYNLIREFSTGISVLIDCTATIAFNTIDNSAGAKTGTGISVNKAGAVTIDRNLDIRGTDTGISVSDASPTVQGNRIRQNNTGISLGGSLSNAQIVGGNVIIQNKTGVFAQNLDFVNAGGTHVQAKPVVNDNAIYDNITTTSPLVVTNFEAGVDTTYTEILNARRNWWGTIVPSEIAAGILDKADALSRPQVDYSSFLDGEGGAPIDTLLTGVLSNSRTLEPGIQYTLSATYLVQSTGALTIPAGTIVKAESGAKLRVEGVLDVSGTVANPALFSSTSATPSPGSWIGIEIAGSGASAIVEGAVIEYATVGIGIAEAGDVTIADSRIEQFKQTGISMTGTTGDWLLDANTIDRLLPGDPAVQEIGIDIIDSSPTLTANAIHNTDIGIRIIGDSQPYLGDLGPPLIPGNEISGNEIGLWLEGREIAGEDPRPILNRNDFFDNATKNVVTTKFSPGFVSVIDARQNWWGTSDPAAIRATLGHDANEPIAFNLAGFLDGPGGNPAPGSTTAMSSLLVGVAHPGTRMFAPTLGETARINFATTLMADVTLEIYTEKVFDSVGTHPPGEPPPPETIQQVLVATQTQSGVLGAGYFEWDGKNQSEAYVPEEAYTYELSATGGGMTARFDPGLNPNDGHPTGNAPTSFNVYQNEPLAFDLTLVQGGSEPEPYPSRITVVARPAPGSPPFAQVILADSRPFAPDEPQSFVFDGRRADGVLLTEQDGGRYSSTIFVGTQWRRVMRPNYLIVHRTKPEVRGIFTPNTAVQSTPYLVTHSYDQVTRFAFQLDQSAFVEVKMLKPGYGDPDDPNAVLAVLPISGSPAQPLAPGTPYSVEWRGYDFDAPAANTDGDLTFVIRATSAVDPTFRTVYRGVVQVRR